MAGFITPSNLQYWMLAAGGFGPNTGTWVVDLITDIALSSVDNLSDLHVATFPGYAQQPTGASGAVLPRDPPGYYYVDLYPVTFLCDADQGGFAPAATGYCVSDYAGLIVWAEVWDPIYWGGAALAGDEWILQLRQILYWTYV